LARVVLVAGFALAAALLLPNVPADQDLVFRLDGDPSLVRRVEATWTAEGEREATGGVRLGFEERAPRSIRHRVSLPNGRYEVAVQVVRETADAALSHTTTTRRVTLEGGETVIPLDGR
jgi:hypothetical protein